MRRRVAGWTVAVAAAIAWSLAAVADSGPVEEPAAQPKARKARAAVEKPAPVETAKPAADVEKPAAQKPTLRWGGDIRIREEMFDNIPIKADPPGVTRGGMNDFFRFRTRL